MTDDTTPQTNNDPQKLQSSIDSLSNEIRLQAAQINKMAAKIEELRTLVGPFGISLPENTVLVQTIHGNKFLTDAMDDIMTPQLIVYRQWERDLTDLFLSLVTKDTVFVDVGANIGYFTVLVASRIGRDGKGQVFSIEANPAISRLLKRNIRINWSMCPINLFEVAVGAESGVARLYAPPYGAANASLSSASSGSASREFVVEMKLLDDLIPSEIAVDVMKIDVEGFELGVMNGSNSVVRRSPNLTLVTEWSMSQMKSAGVNPADVVDKLTEWGMRIHILPENARTLLDRPDNFIVSRDALLSTSYANLVMWRAR